MRKIKFPVGTKRSTRTNVTSVAWATNRRGHNSWKSDNVVGEIGKYLEDHNVVIHPDQHLGITLRWLEDQGYGKRLVKGKRVLLFSFDNDVILSGMEPMFDKPEEVSVSTVEESNPPKPKVVTKNESKPLTQKLVLPPTPAEVLKPPLHRFVEFAEALDKWADVNPDGYKQWVDTVIPWLNEQV